MDSATLATTLLPHLNTGPNPRYPTSLAGERIQSRRPHPLPVRCRLSGPKPNLSCSAIAGFAPPGGVAADDLPAIRLRRLAAEFRSLPEPIDRIKRLLRYAADLAPLPDSERVLSNRVMGCTAQVWLSAAMDSDGRMHFVADSDSEITKGFCSCLIAVLDGARPEEVVEMGLDDFRDLNVVGLQGRTSSRVNTWHNVFISMQKRAKALVAKGEGRPPVEPFPSLVIGRDGIQAKGSYAEAQVAGDSAPVSNGELGRAAPPSPQQRAAEQQRARWSSGERR